MTDVFELVHKYLLRMYGEFRGFQPDEFQYTYDSEHDYILVEAYQEKREGD